MHNLMFVWDCPTCGKRLDDEINYSISVDCEKDRVEEVNTCGSCGHEVSQRLSQVGGQRIPVMEEVSDERAEAFRTVDYDPEQDPYYEDDEERAPQRYADSNDDDPLY